MVLLVLGHYRLMGSGVGTTGLWTKEYVKRCDTEWVALTQAAFAIHQFGSGDRKKVEVEASEAARRSPFRDAITPKARYESVRMATLRLVDRGEIIRRPSREPKTKIELRTPTALDQLFFEALDEELWHIARRDLPYTTLAALLRQRDQFVANDAMPPDVLDFVAFHMGTSTNDLKRKAERMAHERLDEYEGL